MTDPHSLAAALYLGAALATCLGLALSNERALWLAPWALAAGAVAHAVAFLGLHRIDVPPPLTHRPLAVSLMAWIAVLFALVLVWRGRRLQSLAGLVAPFAFLAALWAAQSGEVQATAAAEAGRWPHLHVILSGAGLSLLGVAAVAGVLFLASDRSLKSKRRLPLGRRLPSLEALDRVNVIALALGFPLLSFGVLAGMLWTQGLTGHPWPGGPHATWTAIAWAIYLGLVVARFVAGWRGREAAASAAAGFAFLLFAVIGIEASA